MHTPDTPQYNRREFLKRAGLGAGIALMPSMLRGQQSAAPASPNGKLNVAVVGPGGRGKNLVTEVYQAGANIVALCDVDQSVLRESLKKSSEAMKDIFTEVEKNATWFKDYRVMFEKMGDQIDAVIIATPDHMHYPIALSAINLGKHVYCEKPLTHTFEEAGKLAEAAKAKGVITQMGNQGHSNEGARLVREWVQAGIIGQVREVHSWTNRPVWPQGQGRPDHSKAIPVVPKDLDWNLWLGVADPRPYDPAYAPFNWRGYMDFGTGALGDMACHIMDAANWALDLGFPEQIGAVSTKVDGYTYPKASVVTYEFPARGKMVPLTYKWYDGDMRPMLPKGIPAEQVPNAWGGATFIVGDDATLFVDTYSDTVQVLPDAKRGEVLSRRPKPSIERVKGGHMKNWVDAIKENKPAVSDFAYAAPFTQMILLSVAAIRLGVQLEFDPKAQKFVNNEAANKLLSKEYPSGWILS